MAGRGPGRGGGGRAEAGEEPGRAGGAAPGGDRGPDPRGEGQAGGRVRGAVPAAAAAQGGRCGGGGAWDPPPQPVHGAGQRLLQPRRGLCQRPLRRRLPAALRLRRLRRRGAAADAVQPPRAGAPAAAARPPRRRPRGGGGHARGLRERQGRGPGPARPGAPRAAGVLGPGVALGALAGAPEPAHAGGDLRAQDRGGAPGAARRDGGTQAPGGRRDGADDQQRGVPAQPRR